MNRIHLFALPLAALFGLCLLSCGDSPVTPSSPDVHLKLETNGFSGGAHRAFLFTAVAWNTSATTASVWDGGCGIRPELEIQDAKGAVVWREYCPAMVMPSIGELGEEPVSATLAFDGFILNSERSGLVPAPPGEYKAVATCTFYDFPGGPSHEVRQEQQFNWTP